MKKDKLKEYILEIIEKTLILTIYNDNILVGACYNLHRKSLEREKKIKRLSKKMITVATNRNINNKVSYHNMDRIELFFVVYNIIDDLSLKELQYLREYCCALKDSHNLLNFLEDDIYYKYNNIIDDKICKKKVYK